eukprot:4067517-Pyramimonas_sp.AAC.1
MRQARANADTGAFGAASSGAARHVRGVLTYVRWAHARTATGAFDGAPYGVTKRVRGVPKWLDDWC